MILLSIAWHRWLSWGVFYGEFVVNLALDTWLLRILHRQAVRKQLPWFVSYIAWEWLLTAVTFGTWLVDRSSYATALWLMEAIRVVLLVGAVRESLLRIFKGLEPLLQWLVLFLILGVILYSGWSAVYIPPVQSNRLVSFILAAELAFRWGIVGVSFLSMLLMWSVQEPSGSREDAVVTGAGVASVAFVVNALSRSIFGQRYIFITQYLPDVGYFIAAFYWIMVFKRPIKTIGLKDLGMEPMDIRKQLRSYREFLDLILETVRKVW